MNDLGFPLVLSSYKLFEHCTQRFPKREVVADRNVANDEFYYWNRANELRLIRNKNEVWLAGGWILKRRR